ncbi:uncharacterized protein LOC103723626 isoform X2 [Phoenix dactylifera]|uniref:Uncharacterized protein LOC103723626 isoform X2 n=1 Tax=Phoenix dactylifera TaxID=42345 RepID=A0A8B7D481_PHODC|nr:uncharacterized protein LOC103723626 isoform X2 [Phoenix dactylifera]
MFEGVVSQVLAGYLGRYVKGIQKDQLKIGIWNEQILLEKVELILEAFDYLQLPFALKNGQIGKLSIKIPWKKLGWDPIIVVLEDVYICACQRDDNEWTSDSVGKRELAGKMAKLNAVELGKFSKRVCDNQAGQSFISYISAKILDSIQVSIQNVHIVYIDSHNNQENFIFGLRFSSLTVMTDTWKQSFTGSSMGKSRGGQVDKTVEISNVILYCNLLEETQNLPGINDPTDPQLCGILKFESERCDYIIHPFEVKVFLQANKSGKLDGVPQYDVTAELSTLAVLLNEVQLQQILNLWDYFSICALRKIYGRYRPSQSLLSRKHKGWQKMLWHYAQESVLADVRQRLRKTSWSYLGRRINYRRKYVNLYKRKLELLQQEQLVGEDILQELEKMDKECDIDDILSYRSMAEQQLQDFLLKSKSRIIATGDSKSADEKYQNGEQSSSRACGWLNWLSLGMLGAGGTAETSSFAGVVSDEIIKDIYEATEFHPVAASNGHLPIKDKFCSSSIKLNISQIIASISIKAYDRNIVKAIFSGTSVDCEFWEESAAILASINSLEIVNPCNEEILLMAKKTILPEISTEHTLPFVNVQINMPHSNQNFAVSIKAVIQPFEATYESEFFLYLVHFYHVITSFDFQHNRVLSSLNGFKNFKARLLSKANYSAYNQKKLFWDVTFHNIILKFPLKNEDLEFLVMVWELDALFFRSRLQTDNGSSLLDYMSKFCVVEFADDTPRNFQVEDFYDSFEFGLTGFEIYELMPNISKVSIIEKFNASVILWLCIFSDEPLLKQFEAECTIPSIGMHFSQAIYSTLVGANELLLERKFTVARDVPHTAEIDNPDDPYFLQFSVTVKLDKLNFHVDLEDDAGSSSIVSIIGGDIDIRFALQESIEFWILMKMLKADTFNIKNESDTNALFSSRNVSGSKLQGDAWSDTSAKGCLQLHYQTRRDECIVHHECSLCVNDIDLHISPRITGLLHKFFERLNLQSSSASDIERSFRQNQKHNNINMVEVELSKFGFSNYYDTERSAGIPMDQFPFVSLRSSSFLNSIEGSLMHDISELRCLYVKERESPRGLKLNVRKRSIMKVRSSNTAISSENCHYDNLIILDWSLNGVRAHFHDSSCILGTVTVPASVSSLTFQGTDYWELLVSIQGLILSSSWSSISNHELLWGPSSPSSTPVLNIRARREKRDILLPSIEISFGIQHVCCVLPSEFLALVIGYFSLPEWTAKGNEHCTTGSEDLENAQSAHTNLIYKFEILDSTLILPLESHSDYCLQLGFPQLISSFIPMRNSADAARDIPFDCMILDCTVVDKTDVINIFGRSAYLSLVLLENHTNFPLKIDEYTSKRNIPLIAQLDADMWIWMPCKTKYSSQKFALPTLIMMRAGLCKLIAEDDNFLCGLKAATGVFDQFSSVGKESEMYNFDVLQFLKLKKSLKEDDAVFLDISNESIVNMKFCVKALSVLFSCLKIEDPSSSEIIAKTDMQLNLSAIFRNDIPHCIDVDIPCLVLHSVRSYVPLVSFVSDSSNSSNLCISFSSSGGGEAALVVAVPSLDIWLDLSDWSTIIDLFCSYTRHSGSTSWSSDANRQSESHILPDPFVSPGSASKRSMQEDVNLTIRSENITIALYLPIWDNEEDFVKSERNRVQGLCLREFSCHKLAESVLSSKSNHCKHVKLTFQSKNSELALGKSYVMLTCNLEKVKVMLEIVQNHKAISIPFIHIPQVKVGASLSGKHKESLQTFIEVQVESLDVGFSHQIFNFWSCSHFKIPETTSSRISHHYVAFKLCLWKGSLLLSDGRCCHGPILETLMKNILVEFTRTEDVLEGLADADLLVNYNNIDKVMWEPFIEPWSFQVKLIRKHAGHALLDASTTTDVYLKSTDQLNLNITEPLIEAIFRLNQMIKNALNQNEPDEFQGNQEINGFKNTDEIHTRRYAPYILCNDTSLPLTFELFRGPVNAGNAGGFSNKDRNTVQPGFSLPIYVEPTLDEHFFQHRTYSSERLIEKKMSAVAHHMISIQFDGTSGPSKPMSMDLVGISYFEVNFSKSKQPAFTEVDRDSDIPEHGRKNDERYRSDQNNGLVVPVVFEVSMQHYSKMIRLYSTVVLFNATSVPLELRFDIPFGVSSEILGPILPGQEIPLPLHLAEAGHIRWHPVGIPYLWSEAHSLSNILSQENRLGFMRSFVCYPSHPSSDPFRCCISIQDYSLSPSGAARKCSSLNVRGTEQPTVKDNGQRVFESNFTKKRFIRRVRLTTPLLVKSYLPTCLSLTVDSGGNTHSISLSEVDTASVFLVDSAHDLGITFSILGFRPISSKFPRAESFSAMTKLNGSKFCVSETLTFYSNNTCSGPTSVTLDKSMDAFCGAREMCLSVPYLLYNCTGLLLTVVDSIHERNGGASVIPSNYHVVGHRQLSSEEHGLALLSSEMESSSARVDINKSVDSSKNFAISAQENYKMHSYRPLNSHFPSKLSYGNSTDATGASHYSLTDNGIYSSRKIEDGAAYVQNVENRRAKAYMYAPCGHIPATELSVKLSASLPQSKPENSNRPVWSNSFPLVPASGSTNVTIPRPDASGAFLISSISIPVAGELSGRTRAITFQPRYIICNACNKDLYYRQKGTKMLHHLGVGQHSHLHWSDTTRELLVSIRFGEPGWQWSGSFLPDCLGDAQVKMRNYVSGASNMVRVEVQNADLAISDENLIKNSNRNNGTQLILLSDDKTGFMPYRIDNFSMERLRIYQQRCESFETIVHSYTSCQYAWDEPCFSHRLVVEVPGERILGTYSLDDVKEYVPVYLPPTSEKPERRLYISVHAEGAIKVLSIVDSGYHIVKDMKETSFFGFKEKKNVDQKQDCYSNFTEMVTLHLPFLGISLINSSPQELVFACVKEITVVLMQSLDQQKISFKILSLQIDNQLPDTPYPIMLSFDNEHRGRSMNFLKNKENRLRFQHENISASSFDSSLEPIFYLAAAKWRNTDTSLVSFQYINLGLAPLCIELEEQVLLSLFEYFRTVSSRLQGRSLQKSFELRTLDYGIDVLIESPVLDYKCRNSEFVEIPKKSGLLPSVVPIGAPWQQIYLLARSKKMYVEVFELGPIVLSLSFSSTPWMVKNEVRGDLEPFIHITSTMFQRGLMALVDVEGVPVHLKQLILGHLMASWESIQEILIRHYTRQLLHEMYKVFGSAGVIGNPIGFARNVGLGIRDFLSVSGKEILQSPGGLLTGIAHGSKSLLSSTVYAISSATTQFSKAAHKGIVAFTFDEQAVFEMDEQQKHPDSHGKGVLNEFLEGLTGLLQSPIRGAERHGLPGVLSGIAMGTAGLVARPMASILEATGKTAQSIRNRSSPHQSSRFRIRFPRPLARELPLSPYSWEEAIGVSMLLQADGSRLKDEIFVMCKMLKHAGKFAIISERLVLVVWCSCLVSLRLPDFSGVPPDPGWVIETEMALESIVHIDRTEEMVNIVGSKAETLSKQKKRSMRNRPWVPPTSAPLFHLSVELPNKEEAEDTLQVLLSAIEQGKLRRWGVHMLHRNNLR